jgi:hypothetical protein
MKINGIEVSGIAIAWNQCHKIYICQNAKEVKHARLLGYSIYPMTDLPDIWDMSCSFRFISTWDLEETIVKQTETADFQL